MNLEYPFISSRLCAAAGKPVHRYAAQHLIADLPSDHQFQTGFFIKVDVFHPLKGRSVALDDIDEGTGTVRILPEHQDLQGLFRTA